MDKRRLSKIERPIATKEVVAMSNQGDFNYIITTDMVMENKILLMNFFEVGELKVGNSQAAFRTYLSQDDYITQDLKTQKTKWETSSFDYMNHYKNLYEASYKNGWTYTSRSAFATELDAERAKAFLAEYQREDDISIWAAIVRFQNRVKDTKLGIRHKKITDKIDAVMEVFGEVPDSFGEWVFEHGMSDRRYLVYKATEKDRALCHCTYCNKVGMVDRKDHYMRHAEATTCPFCGSKVIAQAKGKMPYTLTDRRWFIYTEKLEKGFAFRYFMAITVLNGKDNVIRYRKHLTEQCREIYDEHCQCDNASTYEYAEFRQTGKTRWCECTGKISCYEAGIYPLNLPEAFENSDARYCGIQGISNKEPYATWRVDRSLSFYLRHNTFEWICKMGLTKLAIELADNYGAVCKIDWDGKDIFKVLGISKENTRLMQRINGNQFHLRLLQVAESIGYRFTDESLVRFYNIFECNTELLAEHGRVVSLHKLCRYLEKESERYPKPASGCWKSGYLHKKQDPRTERIQNTAKDWRDYIGWCKELKYDITNPFYYMPSNFLAVHDRVSKEYERLQDKKAYEKKRRMELIAAKKLEEERKKVEKLFNKGVLKGEIENAFSLKGFGLCILVPKNAAEIKAEGETLHHCVGNYVNRVAKGETNIFFVRKQDEIDKPFYTMEYKDHIVQCRGYKNSDMTNEVKSFVTAFETLMQKQDKENKKKIGRCV